MSVRRTAILSSVLLLGGCVGTVQGGSGPGGSGPPPTSTGPQGVGGASISTGAGGGAGGGAGAGGSPAGMPPAMLPVLESGPGRLRRLTRAQFENSLRDLLGADVPMGEIERDTERDGFAAVGASYAAVSGPAVEQYDAAIDKALGHVFADPARWTQRIGCRPSGPDDRTCLERLIAGFGRRAWRRPLGAEEIERYATLAGNAARALGDVAQGVLHAVSGLLASPNFLYRVEVGAPDPAAAARYRYGAWEMASRLSYLIWDTTPDEELLAAAESGTLDRSDGIRVQAQRLLASPRARAGLGAFAAQVTGLGDLENTPKNDPRYTPGLRAAMQAEVMGLYQRMLEPGQNALDLYDSTRTFANAELARLYGITGPASTQLEPVELPAAGPRAGVLGTAAFLALNSEQDGTSPTARGVFIREKIMCQHVVEPPEDVDTVLPNPPAGVIWTRRERLEQHRKLPACAACHAIFDPIGYAFERFDWVGALRERDNGKPIDTSGEIDGLAFADARGLAAHLRNSPLVQHCLLENLFRVAFGHAPTEAVAPLLAGYQADFARVKHRWPEQLAEFVASEGFRTVLPSP